MTYLTYLTFSPDQRNMGRKSGMGVWRVRFSSIENLYQPIPIVPIFRKEIRLATVRPYRRGCIVNPLRLALDYLHRKES